MNSETALHVDPVCGMTVDPAKAAGSSKHEGVNYYFCSHGCETKFDADPGKFLKEGPKESGSCCGGKGCH